MFRHSKSKPSRKYLGEADDPHHIPDSPIISRQFFTDEEEEDLKLSCTLALAQVPHSDDPAEDPLACLAAHIEEGQKPEPVAAHNLEIEQVVVPAYVQTGTTDSVLAMKNESTETTSQPFAANESATPSEPSRRGTDVETNISTPLTSPGYTPAETRTRFSDAVRKPQLSQQPLPSKNDTRWPPQLDTKMSDYMLTLPHPSISTRFYADADIDMTRKSSCVPDSEKGISRHDSKVPTDNTESSPAPPARNAQLNLNKSLPTPPLADSSVSSPQRPDSLMRLVKTFKRKAKSTAPTPRDSSDMSRTSPKEVSHQRARISYDPYLASIQEDTALPRRRINFTAFFAKARKPIHQPQVVAAM